MLGEKLGHSLDKLLAPIANILSLNGILSPNSLTLTGFLINLIASASFIFQLPKLAGILILLAGSFDLLDGILARNSGKTTRFGAFLDSVLDRYSDAALFGGLMVYYISNNSILYTLVTFGVMLGSFLISYTRARAEGLGIDCNIGLMERPERIILLSAGAITGLLEETLWILLVLTHITAIQRIYHAWKSTKTVS
ncbi:MAG: CDP-alcohol phosphatidyltransferase family protein [Nitrospirota bacterium]